ncbi:MAG: hypothetical protein ACKVUT_04870 [Gaiella sp.]
MATEKQRRRREKEKRHGFDLVEIDEEGNETVLSAGELKPETDKERPKAKAQEPARRRGRWGEPQPPSWQRTFKRAAIFGPLFVVLILVTGGDKVSVAGAVMNGIVLIAVMIPMMYFLDRVMWNQVQKRQAGKATRTKPRR